jgi:tight adherence protein B
MRSRSLSVAAALAVTAAVALAVPALVGAAAEPDPLAIIRTVDATEPGATEIVLTYTGSPDDLAGLSLTENGTEVATDDPAPLGTEVRRATALVFDTSEALDATGGLVAAKDAARRWVQARDATEQQTQAFAVVAASGTAVLVQDVTTSEQRLLAAIDRVAPPSDESAAGSTALWPAVRLAAELLGEDGGTQSDVVVMTGQDGNVGNGEESVAVGAVTSSRSMLFVAGDTGSGFGPGSVRGAVDTAGGQILTTGEGPEIAGLLDDVAVTLDDGQYTVRYASTVPAGEVAELSLRVGDQDIDVDVVMGSLTEGKPALTPEVTTSSGIGFLQGGPGLALTVGLVLLAAAGMAYAVILVFTKNDELSDMLQPYSEPTMIPGVAGGDGDGDGDGGAQSYAQTAIVARAVEFTEQVAAERGLLVQTENALERANLPLRAGEALFFYGAVVIVLTLLGLVIFGSVVAALIVGLVAALVPASTVSYLARRRKKVFQAQLPDTLTLLSGTLRAGYSLMQGVEAVSQEVDDPMGVELRRVVTETRLGRPLEESLEGMAVRMDSADFAWAVMAIRIQREVGGNLSELLLTVAETMTARERLRRDISALTAEGRISAIVLGLLPVGLGLVMYVINPDYVGTLIETTVGNVMLVLAAIAMLIGFFWMKKIIDIEI